MIDADNAPPRVVSIAAAKKPKRRSSFPDLPDWLEGVIDDDRGRVLPILRNVTLALRSVFIGTTNRAAYLRDDTGGRRFWPIKVGRVDVDALALDRDQLLAEATAAYRRGESWWPDANFEREHVRPEQEARFETDAWEPIIETFLKGRARVQVSEIARDALDITAAKIGTAEQRRITSVLSRLGWTATRDWRGRAYIPPSFNHDA